MKKFLLSVALIFSLLFSGSAVFAGLAALSYTDTNGQTATVAPAQRWINPTGEVSFYLTGGLERKVGYILLDGTGQTVAEGVSASMITAADQFTVLGQTYYGKIMSMPASLEEGDYILKARILDSQGNQVSSQDFPLTVDRTAPEAGDIWWYSMSTPAFNNSIMNNELVPAYYAKQIWVKNVWDAQGVFSVFFESYNPSTGDVETSSSGWYNATAKEAGISVSSQSLPKRDGPLGVRFTLADQAGNKKVVSTVVRFDGTGDPPPELAAVYNPNISSEYILGSGLVGYEPYTPGMTAYANPLKLLYRLPRSNWTVDSPDYGLTTSIGQLVFTDSEYAYFNFTLPYNPQGTFVSSYRFFNPNYPGGSGSGLPRYQLVLSETAPQSPKQVGWQLYISGIGWLPEVHGNITEYKKEPFPITQIRVVVEARPYDQVFSLGNFTCNIPAGQTECTASGSISQPPAGAISGISNYANIESADGLLYGVNPWLCWVMFDFAPPTINSYAVDQTNKTVTFGVIKTMPTGYWGQHTKLYGGLLASNTITGQQVKINGVATNLGGNEFRVNADFTSLPEGYWQFILQAWDESENLAFQDIGQLALDRTPPQIGVFQEAVPLADHGSVTSLGQIRITLADSVDPNAELTSVRLTGGPRGLNVTLASRLQDGAYVLEYPVMFPSLGTEYVLGISARDASGNVATKTVPFNYAPPQINLSSTGQETLNLPAIPANVVHSNGSNALVSDVITINGSPVSGSYDMVLMTAATSTTTIVVNGLTIAPGQQQTLAGYDFASNGGRVDLLIRGDEPGQADLYITSTAPNFPMLAAKLKIWRPEIQLSAEPGWAAQPLIQMQRINLLKGSGTPCRLTMDAQDARAADPINDPVCLVQWNGLPLNYQSSASYVEGVLPPTGDYTPSYEIFIFNNGQQYLITSGSGQPLERSPIQDLAFSAQTTPVTASFYRKVQDITLRLQPSGPYKCPAVAATKTEAQEKGANQVTCLLRWVTVPEGMQPSVSASNAVGQLSGNLNQLGDSAVAWAVDLYSPYGTVENAVSGGTTLTTVNPPLPELSFEAGLYGEKINDSLYITSNLQGGEVGAVKFGTKLLNVNMTLDLNGIDEGHTSKQYVSANNISNSRNIKTGELGLWEARPVTMKLYYTNIPDWVVEKQINVVGVPSKRIKAVLTASNQTLDTIGVPLKLSVGVPGPHDAIIYNGGTDGEWRARLGYLDRSNNFQALTDYQPLTNGTLETTLTGFQIGFQKLQAQVELVTPPSASFYSRGLTSNNAYTTVLKGTAPEGQIYSRTLTGPAPLSSVMSLQVDSDTRRVMGGVEWQLSADNGATWETLGVKSPYQATVTVHAGTYIARAKMTNSLSGAVGYSEGVQLIAYKVPQLKLSAPAAVIVGTPVTLKSQVTVEAQPVVAQDVVIEWYNRTGEKVCTGADYQITPTDTYSMLYTVKARMASAPEADTSAWVRSNLYVRVVPPMAPNGLIAAPGYMEYNQVTAQTYPVVAKMSLTTGLDPAMYPIMGEWHLPDGSTVAGAELNYSPTAADAAEHRALLEYVTWVDGFKDQTTATFRKAVLVGTYAWPEFKVDVKTAPALAPSLVTLTAAPVAGYSGNLEKPGYAWRLPAAAQVVRKQDNGRVMQVNFPEAGSFEVGVTVTDARGSTGEAAGTVSLGEAAPFQVEFAPLFSNSLHRELLDITLRTNVTGGHPQDRLSTYQFSINSPDAQVTSFTGSGVIKGLKAGDYLAHLYAVSLQGKSVDVDYPISVIANQPPTCQVTTWDSGDYRWWKAACQDSDGRVSGLRWYHDDQLISSGQAIRVKKTDLSGTWRFEALDDAGGKYSETLIGPAG